MFFSPFVLLPGVSACSQIDLAPKPRLMYQAASKTVSGSTLSATRDLNIRTGLFMVK
jgi:hypothetical protein